MLKNIKYIRVLLYDGYKHEVIKIDFKFSNWKFIQLFRSLRFVFGNTFFYVRGYNWYIFKTSGILKYSGIFSLFITLFITVTMIFMKTI